MLDAYHGSGGCQEQIDLCQQLSVRFDPENIGNNSMVNGVCEDAETFCSNEVRGPKFVDLKFVDLKSVDLTWNILAATTTTSQRGFLIHFHHHSMKVI